VRFKSRFRGELRGRRLLQALSASVLLHALLLWPDALPHAARQAAQPLTATLRAVQAEATPVTQVAGLGPETKASAISPRLTRPEPPAQLAAVPREEAEGTGQTGWGSPTSTVGAATGTGHSQPAEAAAPDADGLRTYRIVLAREARAHRQYPALAKERGWTGTAEVSVDVSREGRARHILVARSSGHDILDREAVNMMSRAAASAALPESLRGREFAVRLPVVFDISDAP